MIRERTGKGLPGAPRLAHRWAPQALQAACTAALEHARVYDVDVSQVQTMRMAVVTLVTAGIELEDIARRLSLARNTVQVHISQWRKRTGVRLDDHRGMIENAKAARRAGRAPVVATEVKKPAPPPDLELEIYQFMDNLWFRSLQREAADQGRELTLAEVARLPECIQLALSRDADIREAQTAHGPRNARQTYWQGTIQRAALSALAPAGDEG